MSIGQAVSSVFSKYATFSGRARRSEYWWWYVFVTVIGIIANVIDRSAGLTFGDATYAGGWIAGIAGLLLFLPTFAVFVRRLHDTGRSGWWLLLGFIPLIGAIVLLIFTLLDSQADNQYGPSPKRSTGPVAGVGQLA